MCFLADSSEKLQQKRGLLIWLVTTSTAAAFSFAGAISQTQDLKGTVSDEKDKAISGAICTLSGRTLPDQSLTVTTGEQGEFLFPGLLLGTYELACAAVGYEPVAQKGIEVTEEGVPTIQIVLPARVVVRQKVEVRAEGTKVSEQSSAPPASLNTQQFRALPLTQQKFKAALPLVPGVVRTADGKINIKGSVESQGMLLVDAAETVDPVTGSFSIEVPIDAVESVEVHKSAYRAEYGRFSGGLTSVQTKAPSGQRHFELNDFLPSLRVRSGHIVGIADDRPRLYYTGPLWPNKLNFSESLTYEVSKQPVRGLAWPHNETKRQGFDSFTNFQFLFSPSHLLSASADVFPMRLQFADINSFVPQSASSDYGQKGFSTSLTDRYLLHSDGIITTLVKYTRFDSNAHGQGPQDMVITPNGVDGNFFNAWRRNSNQQELLETYQLPHKQWGGRHDLKIGGNFVHRAFTGSSTSHPIQVLRPDRTLAERTSFRQSPAPVEAEDTEAGGFVQDHWAAKDNLAMDLGLRYAGQTIGEVAAFAPRIGAVYSPRASAKTIFRGGWGVFYDRVPLLAGDFTQNPVRIVRFFDENSIFLPPTLVFTNFYERTDPRKGVIIPSGDHLDSTPHNRTWNFEIDQELHPSITLRLNYLSSRTRDVFVVDPVRVSQPNQQQRLRPALLLSNLGGSRYHEFESTIRLHPRPGADLSLSYVESRARGDLNILSQTFVPFEQPVIRRNTSADLPANVPHRFVAWGRFQIPREISISPVLDFHSGFPFSAVDALQNYVGIPNTNHFPAFFSLDLKVAKDFRLPFSLLKQHKIRGGFEIFNVTNHSNPRDVFNNVASPFFGNFVGFQHRFYDVSLDIVY